MDDFGFATKAKARLVARGDMKRERLDFADLYAPTVATSSVRYWLLLRMIMTWNCVTLM